MPVNTLVKRSTTSRTFSGTSRVEALALVGSVLFGAAMLPGQAGPPASQHRAEVYALRQR